MLSFRRTLAAAFAFLALTAPAAAQEADGQWQRCLDEARELLPEIVVASCTALLESERLSQSQRVAALVSRARR